MTHTWPDNQPPSYMHDPHLRVRGFERRIDADDLEGRSGSGGDLLDSISEQGQPQLTGDVTLSEGSNISLNQVGQNIEISATGGDITATYAELYYMSEAPCGQASGIVVSDVTQCTYSTITTLTAGLSNEMSPVGLTGIIPIEEDGYYIVQFGLSLAGATDGNNKFAAVHIDENPSKIIAEKAQLATGADYFMNMKAKGILELESGQELSVRVTHDNFAPEDITVYLMQFTAIKL